MRVVCLLPARNAAEDVPGYLESVGRVADAVVALDDASSDKTGALLADSPLVEVLLAGTRRASFRGWDDGANRRRLLEAAAELEPDWILSLDADERLDADDAHVLRELLEREAGRLCALGLERFQMWGERAYDPSFTRIYRAFGYRAGQRFPDRRLHFTPIPTAIPRAAWIDTTVRVRHLNTATERRRLALVRKYLDADSAGAYTDVERLVRRPPGDLPLWDHRPVGLPPIIRPAG